LVCAICLTALIFELPGRIIAFIIDRLGSGSRHMARVIQVLLHCQLQNKFRIVIKGWQFCIFAQLAVSRERRAPMEPVYV
jgi:hypothetical protein